jgi:hypothetical protein
MVSPECAALIDAALDCHLEGDLDGALRNYGNALDLSPGNTMILYNIGCVFEEAGSDKEAAETFRLAATICLARGQEDPEIDRAVADFDRKEKAN